MKPLPFCQTYAHPDDPLPLHLERVAQRAAAAIAPPAVAAARRVAFIAGLFHDIGKATPYFQNYLLKTKRKTNLTPHAKSGAVLSWWYTGELGLELGLRLAVFIAVLRHHGALDYDTWWLCLDRVRDTMEDGEDPLHKQLAALDLDGIRQWLQQIGSHHAAIVGADGSIGPLTLEALEHHLLDRSGAGRRQLRRAFRTLDDALIFLAGFGGLLAVDKIDAATQGAEIVRQYVPAAAVEVYMEHYRQRAVISPLDERRARIAAEVRQTWLEHLQAPLLTLTAPTGSGKTLTILNAALALRGELQDRQGYPPRIIYCLPFTSVIDQNHAVFQAVLTANGLGGREDILLKHHHLVDGLFRTAEAEYLPDGAGQLLTETWQSEIVVTTFYQLMHTLLSNQNANLKRAGQLTGSIILMDEVQAIPLCYWEGLRCLLQGAARTLGARFVLLTATRPLIFRPQDAHELLPSHTEHFQALDRVRLICHQQTPLTLDEFTTGLIETLNPATSTLIILNRRRAVRSVFAQLQQAVPDSRLIALSTDLTPRDRRARIRLIQRLQRQRQPCIVVSTQLIEAGVDVSFPVVHRDLAPLDSIIQSAGRCNRHAAPGQVGEVHLWSILTESESGRSQPLWQRVYDSPLIEVTTAILGKREYWEESDFLALSQDYFEGCWQRHEQVRVDEWLTEGNFEKLHREFQLIPDGPPTASYFVVRRPADEALWQRYRAIQVDAALSALQKDQAFRKIRHAFYERVIQVYARPDPDSAITRLQAGDDTYTRQTGFFALPPEESTCIF